MPFPNDENGDVLRRMEECNFDFAQQHDVDFFAVFRTEEMADQVARQFAGERNAGEDLPSIATRPADAGGMELHIVKRMLVTHKAITDFEQRLGARVGQHDGYLDGWGVMQN